MGVYRNYGPEALELQYDPEAGVAGVKECLDRYANESRRLRASHPAKLDVAYGPGPAQQLDIYLAEHGERAPIQVFVHGGAWKGSSKEDRSFPASAFCSRGAAWIGLEYPLAPAVALDEIVQQVREGIAWIYRNAATFGADPSRLYISGSSAGAHLCAMVLATDWKRFGLAPGVIAGATLISGIFDLDPLRLTRGYAHLALDPESVARNSPIHHLPERGCPLIVAVGRAETAEFVRQSVDYFRAWTDRGFAGHFMVLDGHHHFSIMGEMSRHESPLHRAMLAQMGLALEPAR